jgi:hypothetical protein
MTRSIYIRDIEESFLNRNSTGLEFSMPVAASTDNKWSVALDLKS